MVEQVDAQKKAVISWEAHAETGPQQGPVDPGRSTGFQVGLMTSWGLMLEQAVLEGLYPTGRESCWRN